MVKFSGPPQASHSTSPDSLVERIKERCEPIRKDIGRPLFASNINADAENLIVPMVLAEVDALLERASSDSELLRLANEMVKAVEAEHRGWHDGTLDAAGPFAACGAGMCVRARAYLDARSRREGGK